MGLPGPKGDKGGMGQSGSPVSDCAKHTPHNITAWGSLSKLESHICHYPEWRTWFLQLPSYYLIRDSQAWNRPQEWHCLTFNSLWHRSQIYPHIQGCAICNPVLVQEPPANIVSPAHLCVWQLGMTFDRYDIWFALAHTSCLFFVCFRIWMDIGLLKMTSKCLCTVYTCTMCFIKWIKCFRWLVGCLIFYLKVFKGISQIFS